MVWRRHVAPSTQNSFEMPIPLQWSMVGFPALCLENFISALAMSAKEHEIKCQVRKSAA